MIIAYGLFVLGLLVLFNLLVFVFIFMLPHSAKLHLTLLIIAILTIWGSAQYIWG